MTYIDYLNQFHQWIEGECPTDKTIILYYGLLNLFNRRGWPDWAGIDTQRLLVLARSSDRTVAYRARDALIAAGFLTYRPGKKGRITEYRLCRNGKRCPQENATINATKNATENTTENATPNKTKTKTKTKTIPPITPQLESLGFHEPLATAFTHWLVYKAEKQQPYSPTGLQALEQQVREKAAQYGEEAVAALIQQCMACNWQGLIWDKLERNQRQQEKNSLWSYDPGSLEGSL